MNEFGRKLLKVDEEQVVGQKNKEPPKEAKAVANIVNLSNMIGIIHQHDKDRMKRIVY